MNPLQSPNTSTGRKLGEPRRSQAPTLWLCWTNNCRGKLDTGLYVLHAVTDGSGRTLCGCRIQEFGERVTADAQPSCKRCRRILKKLERIPS